MRYRALDQTGDYKLCRPAEMLTENEAVRQAITTRLKLLLGEWWEDLTIGLPLFQYIVGQYNSENARNEAALLIRDQVLSVQEVKSVTNLQVVINQRTIYVSLSVETTYGELAMEVLF